MRRRWKRKKVLTSNAPKDSSKGKLKTADQVMHERMAALPYIKFERFNVKKYIDMGLKRYKYDYGIPGKDKYAKKNKSSEMKKKSNKK